MRARLLLCVLLALSVRAWGQAAATSTEDTERIQLADGLFARGMYSLAGTEYEAILRETPDLPTADVLYFRLGECYRQQGRTLDAEKAFRRVFIGYPKSTYRHRAGFRRAGLFMDVEHYDGAVDLYRAVLDEKPDAEIASASWYLMGEALLKLDRRDEAAAAFQRVIKDYTTSTFHPYALLKLGQVYSGMADQPERADEAVKLFQTVADKPPTARLGAEAVFQVAEWHYRRKDFKQAAAAYGRLRREYPEDTRTLEARLPTAWAMHRAGLYADALAIVTEMTQGKETPASHDEWLYLKANCERQLMRHAQAVTSYRQLIEGYPDSRFTGPARYEMALAHYKSGDYPAAVALARGLTGEPDLLKDVYWLLAESYAAMDQPDEAIQFYRLLARDHGRSDVACDAIYRLAYHLQARGDFSQAAEFFAAAAQGWPKRELAPRARFAAGYCEARGGRHDVAVQHWDALLKAYHTDPLVEEAMYQKGMSEIRLERYADALNTLRALTKRFPASPFGLEARYWEGMTLRELKRVQDAEASFRYVLKQRNAAPELRRNTQLALAVLLHERGNSHEAADLFQALLEGPARENLNAPLIAWLAEHRIERKQYAQALAASALLTDAAQEARWQQTGWLVAGRCHQAQRRLREARGAFGKCIALDPGTLVAGEAALALGNLALEAGDHEIARTQFERAASSPATRDHPALRAKAYAGLGRIAAGQDDHAAAARYYMSVAILYDDPHLVPECLHAAAAAFQAMGDGVAATNALNEVARRYPNHAAKD